MIIDDGLSPIAGYLRRWRYNALDAEVTGDVAAVLLPRVEHDPFYGFAMHQQVVAFAMGMRGILVDGEARIGEEQVHVRLEQEAVSRLNALVPSTALPYKRNPQKCTTKSGAHRWLGTAACKRCGVPAVVPDVLNPHSHEQVAYLFYDVLDLSVQRNHKTHEPSVDKECLERLARSAVAAPMVAEILAAREARDQAALMRTSLDPDNRWRSGFNVGAASTARWSASANAWGTGGNIQNIAHRSRNIFVADPGFTMFYADYEKAESSIVAYDAEDVAYIAAHESGDVHTEVARLVWPHVHKWTGDPIKDRALAEMPAPWDPHHPLRWYGKHIAHGTAIGMTEHGIARDARIKKRTARAAQEEFLKRFPRIAMRQDEIWQAARETRMVISPLGRQRTVHGRLYGAGADATRRELLAQIQQSMIADWIGIAICRIWETLDGGAEVPRLSDPNRVWLLAQVHDAILGLVRTGDNEALAQVRRLMGFHLDIRGRRLTIPVKIEVGPNWRDMGEWK